MCGRHPGSQEAGGGWGGSSDAPRMEKRQVLAPPTPIKAEALSLAGLAELLITQFPGEHRIREQLRDTFIFPLNVVQGSIYPLARW